MSTSRAVFDRISCAIGWRTLSEVMATIRPQPRSCIGGAAAFVMATTDMRLRFTASRY